MTTNKSPRRQLKGPKIVVKPPGPKSKQALALKEKFVTDGVRITLPIEVDRGEGPFLSDVDGNIYIDLTAGIGVHNTGHRPRQITQAAHKQLDKLTHICFMVAMYQPYIELSRQMAEITPGRLPMSLWQNSGSEAIENAVKIARAYTGKKYIISFRTSFHGRTMMGMSMSGKMKPYKIGFGPFLPEVVHAEYGYCYRCPLELSYPGCDLACVDTIREMAEKSPLKGNVACLLAEPEQGEGGFIAPPPGYFEKLYQVCLDNGIVFIDDEVQAGMGRTGKMWGIQHWRVVPDLLVSGKALGGGLPLGGVTGKREIMRTPGPASLGGTFGGSPVSCAAALASIKLVKKALPRVPKLNALMLKRLNDLHERYAIIGDVRGKGAMLAIELVKDRATKEIYPEAAKAIQLECLERGVLVLTAGFYNNVIRLLPPLNIPLTTMDKALGILAEAVDVVSDRRP